MDSNDFQSQINKLNEAEEKARIEKAILLDQALKSSNPDLIYKAMKNVPQNVEKKADTKQKSLLIDPMSLNVGAGYREKHIALSYTILRNMGRVPLIKAIIETRKEQVADFAQPQRDKYSTGFIIEPKRKFGEKQKDLTKAQEKRIHELTEFILYCGADPNSWTGDNFETFLRKSIDDTLTFDQWTFENIFTLGNELAEFMAVDGSTFRFADTQNLTDEKKIKGYFPAYVQVYQGRVVNEYYPWELCFAIRNPKTNIYSNGYGVSELEDLIHTVTAILNADAYNANYFKVGSNPKGILKVTNLMNAGRIEEFKDKWQSEMTGVANAHKIPIIEAEKLDFISTQQSNKDMEYSNYQEFLIKIACAVFKIDPAEINFPMSGSSEQKPLFEGNNAARLKFSKDKGLKPLLNFVQFHINNNIFRLLDPEYEFRFVGLESQTAKEELEDDVMKIQNFMTLNEIRNKNGLDPVPNGDVILNPIYAQQMQMAMMGGGASNENVYNEYGVDDEEEENPFSNNDKNVEKSLDPITSAALKSIIED